MEEQVPPEKNETGTAIPGVKVDRCGEWGLQLVSPLSPELVLTSAAWGLSAALVKGTVGKILSRFASCHSASLSFGGMIPCNGRNTLALKQLCRGAPR